MEKIKATISPVVLFFLFWTVIATLLFLNSQVNYLHHLNQTDRIRNIQEQTSILIRDLLLVEKSRFSHYDSVTESQKTLMNLAKQLSDQEPLELELKTTVKQLIQQVDSFKSEYALYRNSLVYFPKGVQHLRFLEGSEKKISQEFIQQLIALERQVFLFNVDNHLIDHDNLLRQFSAVTNTAKKLPDEYAESALVLLKHADILISHYSQLKSINQRLLKSDIVQQTHALLSRYKVAFQRQVDRSAQVRNAFYLVSLLLMAIVVVTISRLRLSLDKMQESEQRLRQVADNAPVMLWMTNTEGRLVFTNQRWEQEHKSGFCKDRNIYSDSCLDQVHPDDRENLQLHYKDQKHSNEVSVIQYRVADGQGGYSYWLENLVNRFSVEGEHIGYISSIIDISHQKQLEDEVQLAAMVFEYSLQGIILTDKENKIIKVNHSFTEMTGYQEQEVLGKEPDVLNSGMQSTEFYEIILKELLVRGTWQGEVYNQRKNGEIFPEWLTMVAVKNDAKEITHYISIFNDITEKKKAAEDINFLAHYDVLTRLPNRTMFNDRLEHALLHAKRNKHSVALLFLDLDRFKVVNDSMGHGAGDELLKQVARDLRHCVRETDTVARLGGDEFTVVLEDVNEEVSRICPIVADKIIQALSREYLINDKKVFIGVSIGIAVYPEDGGTIEQLLQRADMAMYHAKEQGRNIFRFYSSELNEQVQEKLYLETELRQAIDRNQLFLHYQPQYRLSDQTIIGFEALLRWQHPKIGEIPPDQFVCIAEESGLILEMGEWVLKTAASQLVQWQRQSQSNLSMSINVSVKQLEREGFVEAVQQTLVETGLSPECIELEVTESIFLDEDSITLKLLNQLDRLGVQLAMDDFGTGYSNMSYLKKLPIDRIKIDRCFVSELPNDEDDMAIVCAVIDIARHFKIGVIAEGIDQQEQAEYLLKQGCDIGQGYFYSKPLSAEEASKLIV